MVSTHEVGKSMPKLLFSKSLLHSVLILSFGFSLCSSVPLLPIGPSFITWLSAAEISGYILLFLAIKDNLEGISSRDSSIKKTRLFKVKVAGWLSIIYVVIITFIITSSLRYSNLYPIWSLIRLIHWSIVLPYILSVCSISNVRLLGLGIVLGGLINSFAAIAQKLNLLKVTDLVSYVGSLPGAGPWGTIYENGGLLAEESIGIFSFSRTATGFFLAISIVLVISLFKRNVIKIIFMQVISIGLAMTGSRLGFFSLFFVLISLLISRKSRWLGVIALASFAIGIAFNFDALMQDTVTGRLFGQGTGDFEAGFEGRAERQSAIFTLPIEFLFAGCGLGNLGSALGFSNIGLNFYRAHGFFATYLAEVGVLGILLIGRGVYLFIRNFHLSALAWSLLASVALSGFSDDFMIPSASASHIPIIVAVILRTTITPISKSIKFKQEFFPKII